MNNILGIINEQTGQSMAEYAFLLSFIALAVLGALTVLGTTVRDFFSAFQALM